MREDISCIDEHELCRRVGVEAGVRQPSGTTSAQFTSQLFHVLMVERWYSFEVKVRLLSNVFLMHQLHPDACLYCIKKSLYRSSKKGAHQSYMNCGGSKLSFPTSQSSQEGELKNNG